MADIADIERCYGNRFVTAIRKCHRKRHQDTHGRRRGTDDLLITSPSMENWILLQLTELTAQVLENQAEACSVMPFLHSLKGKDRFHGRDVFFGCDRSQSAHVCYLYLLFSDFSLNIGKKSVSAVTLA